MQMGLISAVVGDDTKGGILIELAAFLELIGAASITIGAQYNIASIGFEHWNGVWSRL